MLSLCGVSPYGRRSACRGAGWTARTEALRRRRCRGRALVGLAPWQLERVAETVLGRGGVPVLADAGRPKLFVLVLCYAGGGVQRAAFASRPSLTAEELRNGSWSRSLLRLDLERRRRGRGCCVRACRRGQGGGRFRAQRSSPRSASARAGSSVSKPSASAAEPAALAARCELRETLLEIVFWRRPFSARSEEKEPP